jgi:hypothetical protein
MTREQFVKRWETLLAGHMLSGLVSETRDGTLARAARVLDIPDEARKLLGRLYDDLIPPKKDGK